MFLLATYVINKLIIQKHVKHNNLIPFKVHLFQCLFYTINCMFKLNFHIYLPFPRFLFIWKNVFIKSQPNCGHSLHMHFYTYWILLHFSSLLSMQAWKHFQNATTVKASWVTIFIKCLLEILLFDHVKLFRLLKRPSCIIFMQSSGFVLDSCLPKISWQFLLNTLLIGNWLYAAEPISIIDTVWSFSQKAKHS